MSAERIGIAGGGAIASGLACVAAEHGQVVLWARRPDAATAKVERLIEKPDENLVLNLGYGRGLSVLEVLDALNRLIPEPIRIEMKGRRAGDPPLLISSNEALKATLDWQARYADIDTILTHALEWERNLQGRIAA